eukprot:TRINITY_DN4785_c0_g1_i1.p1 TRINITY_DN4785_c0_g1~~TRINITY_DN4785_c0_g1_i1.p1  ORF type:complete len:665 (-),score=172.29 TRINITY_DN4785_c0_g1_i1:156-2150(-)
MEAASRCRAASCRLGFRMRRSSDAGCRRELRMAQRAVDDTSRVIQASFYMSAVVRKQGQLDNLLCALMQHSPVASRGDDLAPQKKDFGSQTDHLLRSQVHALTSSKATENPSQDLPNRFELRLMVTGPELDNSSGVIACSDPKIKAKIKVEGMDLCFGELLWSIRQLCTGPSVECKVSTQEVLEMSKRILAARGEHSWKADLDEVGSEVSTDVASSLGHAYTSEDICGLESDDSLRPRPPHNVLASRRIARARRRAGCRPHSEDAQGGATLRRGERGTGEAKDESTYTDLFSVPESRTHLDDALAEGGSEDNHKRDNFNEHEYLRNTSLKTYRFIKTKKEKGAMDNDLEEDAQPPQEEARGEATSPFSLTQEKAEHQAAAQKTEDVGGSEDNHERDNVNEYEGVRNASLKTYCFKKDTRLQAEDASRLQAEEEARSRAEEEARLKAEEVARAQTEEKARLKAEDDARLQAEEEARRKAEKEARLQVEDAARLQAEEEAHYNAEEEARLKAEEVAKVQTGEKARFKAEEDARLQAQEEARSTAEEEARLKEEEDARLQAEEETHRKAEEEGQDSDTKVEDIVYLLLHEFTVSTLKTYRFASTLRTRLPTKGFLGKSFHHWRAALDSDLFGDSPQERLDVLADLGWFLQDETDNANYFKNVPTTPS